MSVSMKTTTARVALGTVLMGAVPMAPLRVLGHENTAVRQALRFVEGEDGRRFCCAATVVFVAVRDGLAYREY